jgi:hypothetical protein
MDYSKLTKKELYLKAKEMKVSGYSSMTKDELIKVLTAQEKKSVKAEAPKKEEPKKEAPPVQGRRLVFNSQLHRWEYK